MNLTTRTLTWLIGGMLLLSAGPVFSQDWPQWRGANRDNHVTGFAEPKTWPKELAKKWRVTVGNGESSPLLVGDKLYVFGRIGSDEVAMCLDAMTGKQIWASKQSSTAITGAASKHPGPRSTPAVGEGKMCTLGVRGAVSCFDAKTGDLVWRKETNKTGKPAPQFWTSSSPLIADGKCIVYVDALTAYDLADGAVKWQWKDGATPYGSPNLMTVDGAKQVVTPFAGGVAGVDLADGKLLWKVSVPGPYQSNYSTPIIDGQTFYYSASGGKGGGGNTLAYKVEKTGAKYAANELWKKPFATHFYHTPVLKDNRLVGVTSGRTFFAVDAKTGAETWKDSAKRGECGSILDAGTVFLSVTSDKKLVAFKANNDKYAEVATYTVAEGEPWSVPIVVGNRIYVKEKGTNTGSLTLWTIE